MPNLVLVLLAICIVWALAAAIGIGRYLEQRGYKVGMVWLRLRMIEHAQKYRELTLAESGRVGALYYLYLIPMGIIVLLVALALIDSLRHSG